MSSPSSLHHHTFITLHLHHSIIWLQVDITANSRSTTHTYIHPCIHTYHNGTTLQSLHSIAEHRLFIHTVSILATSLLHDHWLLSLSFSHMFHSLFSPFHTTVPPIKIYQRCPATRLEHFLQHISMMPSNPTRTFPHSSVEHFHLHRLNINTDICRTSTPPLHVYTPALDSKCWPECFCGILCEFFLWWWCPIMACGGGPFLSQWRDGLLVGCGIVGLML